MKVRLKNLSPELAIAWQTSKNSKNYLKPHTHTYIII